MASNRVIQFTIKGTPLSYGMKLTYDDSGVLQEFNRQDIRRNDRSVDFNMLNPQEQNAFVEHFRGKVHQLPVVRQ